MSAYFDMDQLGALINVLEEKVPLQHRAVFIECAEVNRPSVTLCADKHLHFSYHPEKLSVVTYTLMGVFAYILALALDESEMPTEPTKEKVAAAVERVYEALVDENKFFANRVRHIAMSSYRFVDGGRCHHKDLLH